MRFIYLGKRQATVGNSWSLGRFCFQDWKTTKIFFSDSNSFASVWCVSRNLTLWTESQEAIYIRITKFLKEQMKKSKKNYSSMVKVRQQFHESTKLPCYNPTPHISPSPTREVAVCHWFGRWEREVAVCHLFCLIFFSPAVEEILPTSWEWKILRTSGKRMTVHTRTWKVLPSPVF